VSRPDLTTLIEASDLDGLVLAVNGLCDAGDWDGLVALGARCRAALERGRQLWPVASHIEYRLALSAPGEWAGTVVAPGAGRFAPGPLPEVAASTHGWEELAPWVPDGPLAAVCAHERVVRGEDLSAWPGIDSRVLEIPLRLAEWEPEYPVATYHGDRGEFPMPVGPARPALVDRGRPALVDRGPAELGPQRAPAEQAEDPEVCRALLDLAGAWTTESDGRAEAVAVVGDAAAAVAALGVPAARLTPMGLADSMALLAWTGASGGAHGRRRGMAAGRFGAWWVLGALCEALDEWPVSAESMGERAEKLRWFRWDAGDPETGWVCRIAVEQPSQGRAWSLAATDSA